MNMKAALYEPARKIAKRGRRRKQGNRLPSPLQMAQDPKAHWIKATCLASTTFPCRRQLFLPPGLIFFFAFASPSAGGRMPDRRGEALLLGANPRP
jgi:hypothetical protein